MNDVHEFDTTNNDQMFQTAVKIVDRSGVVDPLAAALSRSPGPKSVVGVRALFVTAQMNALGKGHKALVANVANQLAFLSKDQREALGLGPCPIKDIYDRTDRLFARVADILDQGLVVTETAADGHGTPLPEGLRRTDLADDGPRWGVPTSSTRPDGTATEPLRQVGPDWFLQRVGKAGIDPDLQHLLTGCVAVDGTAWSTSARLRGAKPQPSLDGAAEEDDPHTDADKKSAQELAVGPDGRIVWTVDTDARSGYATATNGTAGGKYVGYEVHVATNIRGIRHTDGVENVVLGPPVPPFITNVTVVPAGSHRADSIVPALLAAKQHGQPLTEVVFDPGYSLGRTETWALPLRAAGVDTYYKPVKHQRPQHQQHHRAIRYDDTLLHPATPPEIRCQTTRGRNGHVTAEEPFPYPPYGTDPATTLRYQRPFNHRARFRLRLHKKSADGTHWFRCPFCAGGLSAPNVEVHNGRKPGRDAIPVNKYFEDLPKCCDGLIPISHDQLGRWQPIPAGTTAHYIAYHGRRQQVENAFSAFKASFTQLDHKHALVLGLTKRSILLGFTVAGANHRIGTSWNSRPTRRR